MAKPQEKLADSLKTLKELQSSQGSLIIRASSLSRTHKERLLSNGFIREVIKGWYIPSRPDEAAGESTSWYASFWEFCSGYLTHRFGDEWCLSPEQSLNLHSGNQTIPKQLLVRSPKAGNKVTSLLYDTSLLDVRAALPNAKNTEKIEGMRVFSIPSSLVYCGPSYFHQHPTESRSVLSSIVDSSSILEILLEGGHSKVAGRLAGAFRNIGRDRIANDILETMRIAGYDVREECPFDTTPAEITVKKTMQPSVARLYMMWEHMRAPILANFPETRHNSKSIKEIIQQVEDVYVKDAYNSLSIEGYQVSPELIERISRGGWNPDENKLDLEHRNALAARGYWQAFQSVKSSLAKILEGTDPGLVIENDISTWYRELFAPSVVAGILDINQLVGYRNSQVFIRKSRHIPPSCESVRELMPAFFELLKEETHPQVRVILGHFVFVYIHPYIDGNGRMGRFLMNLMLASSGYPWTIISVDDREDYFKALEEASVQQNIIPFTQFIKKCIENAE